jgi:monovalent cation:H+ antiporter, CPA1 family
MVKISVLLLATVGVVITTLIAGLLLIYIAHLPFQIAFVFVALISSTDAAIVIKTFKMLKAPKLLSTILEMESFFNNTNEIIIFTSVVGIVLDGHQLLLLSLQFLLTILLSIILIK